READLSAMRDYSFLQVGIITGVMLLLLIISYIFIHRYATRIKQYKRKTTDLIGQLQKSVKQIESLIASRKKAMHTITHELRTPLTAIHGCAELRQDTEEEQMSG
ncbi:histidine kinase dimerization/phospho-acceptor domain-containing protein, partial [Alistipes putredinis]|uniref:histidine kinase dimerization/phospho-acceptor domain-containing protein n=1 Tax=Alistipes putredinis TaxID=28117 RepID=UPI0023B0701C